MQASTEPSKRRKFDDKFDEMTKSLLKVTPESKVDRVREKQKRLQKLKQEVLKDVSEANKHMKKAQAKVMGAVMSVKNPEGILTENVQPKSDSFKISSEWLDTMFRLEEIKLDKDLSEALQQEASTKQMMQSILDEARDKLKGLLSG